MRILILVLFSLLCFYSHGQKKPDSNPPEMVRSEYSIYKSLFTHEKTVAGNMYNLVYHRFDLRIDPAVKYIRGSVTSYFIAEIENLQEITFDFSDSLIVDSIVFNNESLLYQHENNILSLYLSYELTLHQLDSVSISYHGIPDYGEGFGSFSQGFHDGAPIIWTLSEPYGAKDWWPCKQNLNDKIDSIDLYITVPDSNKVASNGVLLSEKNIGDSVVFHWKHRYPIAAYLIAIAVTNYAEYSEYAFMPNGDSLEVLNYVFSEKLTDFQNSSADLLEVIEFFSEKFIPYPFANEKYGHAQFLWGGGMEHQTMSFVTSASYGLIVHELAHQWFGDYITCGSWQDIWLNEGSATFLSGLAIEKFKTDEYLNYKRGQINEIVKQNDGSVFREDTSIVSNIFYYRMTYVKAGMVLNMLRHELGDYSFFEGIRNYLTDAKIINSYARTEDLKRNLEMAADTSLNEFFNDWYLGEGFPSYTVNWWQDSDNMVKLSIEQTQSDESVDFFEMHLSILLEGTERDTLISIHHTENGQEFFLSPDFIVSHVEFDPFYDIVKGRTLVMKSTLNYMQKSFNIYPNPVNGELTIISLSSNFINEIVVYNLRGELIDSLMFDKGTKTVLLNTSQFTKGIKIIKIISGNSFYVQKLIVN